MEIGALRDMVKEELKKILGLFGFVSHDALGEPLVYIKSFFSCYWVFPDERMLMFNET